MRTGGPRVRAHVVDKSLPNYTPQCPYSNKMMYKMVAVPGAEAQIKKGRVLDSDEFMAALEAQIPAHLSGKPSPAA